MCRFDFNPAWVAIFKRSRTGRLKHNAQRTADRGSRQIIAKSRRRKFILDAAECRRRRTDGKPINNFQPKNFLPHSDSGSC
jgi:hypothetical protein